MLKVDKLLQFHDQALKTLNGPAPAQAEAGDPADLWDAISLNHQCNALLWLEEDQARRNDVPAERIVAAKRRIDALNQQRNDAVEHMDDALLARLAGRAPQLDARLHSETPGAMMDRLSILALKIFHMGRQLERDDAEAAHIARCSEKLHRLRAQRSDLADCLREFINDIQAGRAYFKAYRQYKMYNDPAFNPWLGRRAAAAAAPAASPPGSA